MLPTSPIVAVIGAGPAGLAASHALAGRKIDHVVLEKGEAVGHSWSNVYENLRLHTGKHMSALPGMPFPRSTPLFALRQAFLDYLQTYTRRFRLPVETRCAVASVQRPKPTSETDRSVVPNLRYFIRLSHS